MSCENDHDIHDSGAFAHSHDHQKLIGEDREVEGQKCISADMILSPLCHLSLGSTRYMWYGSSKRKHEERPEASGLFEISGM